MDAWVKPAHDGAHHAAKRQSLAKIAAYFAHAAKASAKARSPGVPFSIARMARRLLL